MTDVSADGADASVFFVLRWGGIIFTIAVVVWAMVKMINDEGLMINDCYPWFVLGLVLVAGVSFVDDIRSLPDSVRLVVQFAAMGLMFVQLFVSSPDSAIAGVRAVGEGGMTWVMHDNHNDNDDIVLAHWMYLIGAAAVLAVAYVAFKRKYYHLHEEYLASIARDK